MTEREKMLAGELYDPLDAELATMRVRARDLCWELNATRDADDAQRRRILRELFGTGGDAVWLQPPFFCDYGTNIHLGEKVFFNFNCVLLDVCEIRIGDRTLFGPAVQIYAATHPMDVELRKTREFGKPVVIGSDVWVGGGAIICPRRDDRRPCGDRRGERGDARRAGRRVRGRQPVPRTERDLTHKPAARARDNISPFLALRQGAGNSPVPCRSQLDLTNATPLASSCIRRRRPRPETQDRTRRTPRSARRLSR